MNTDHTLEHFRERWYPTVFERVNFETWRKKGGKMCAERASETVGRILSEHRPEPLPAEIRDKLRDIVRRAKAE